ncbi:YARHG domain-containing protein [Myxococcota bacterium]|nr:YARHG domain-containing protein [Myxococcota bacterium]MBU1430780.1 YARHG domain-containing protein [Myxococcota bacterium]MBU1900007.1 YARHG domain-containing protein [Myxococcota bacterium]
MKSALFLAVSLALTAPALGAPTPMLSDWDLLLAGGCDLDKAHVLTPIETRALRNVPYAQAGHVFQSEELTALYKAEGWYTPKPGVVATIKDPKVGACIKKLKALEAKLKRQIPMKKAFIRRFMRSPEAIYSLRGLTSAFPKGIGAARYRGGKPGEPEAWDLIGAEDKDNQIQLTCDQQTCFVNAPG